MSGHSKWSTIKHKKARTDEKKGKEYTRIAKEIILAARSGGGDPEANSKLKLAIQKAKAINMPNDNINRAIKRGTGDLESDVIEEMNYEGYAAGGVAILLDIATDNRNRTASDIRHLFSKHGGNLGETGCVSYLFDRVGLITVNREDVKTDEEEFMLLAIELGADDVREDEDSLEIITSPESFMDVKEKLELQVKIEYADIVMLPQTSVEITDENIAAKILKLIDVLEDHDDVQNLYSNLSIPDELLEKLS
ncbi:Transcriptional regulator TACO1-like [Syntrophomonas zehnderi OL-4]|uniref:Probable transcriptional regulatory protein 2282 n=1 Tax=Syntrophomonas zehnderi OL-4 TaxID=690567 RepID=A0A0E4GCD7_9FIRM|nr:YebC/PmpR family DNA-binding transcriptional regulator [Syntrophomonas zehnderi]CFX94851.1 Transcriptional regulator TACO1-like [Syntrophomonas zehnderi OL-4]